MIIYALDNAGRFTRLRALAARVVWAVNASGYFEATFEVDEIAGKLGITNAGAVIYVFRDSADRIFRGFPDEVTFTSTHSAETVTVSGVGVLGLFARRIVYGEKKFSNVPADDAIKALLRDALQRDGATQGAVIVEPDTGSAPLVTLDCSWRARTLDAINDITESTRGVYVFSVDNEAVSSIATRYIVTAPQHFNFTMSTESRNAARVSYSVDYGAEKNVVWGMGRRQDNEHMLIVGPFTRGAVTLVTRRENIYNNPSGENADELEGETRMAIRQPEKRIAVETHLPLRIADAVLVGTYGGNVAAIVTAVDYSWPDDTTSYTLEALDA